MPIYITAIRRSIIITNSVADNSIDFATDTVADTAIDSVAE